MIAELDEIINQGKNKIEPSFRRTMDNIKRLDRTLSEGKEPRNRPKTPGPLWRKNGNKKYHQGIIILMMTHYGLQR